MSPLDSLATRGLEFLSFEYAFARDALLAAVIVGALCGLVGTFLVLRNLSMLGDAAGHATLPGVCLAFLVVQDKHMPTLLGGAMLTSLLAAGAVHVLARGKRGRPDAAVGIVLSVFFGAGIVLLSYVQASPSAAQSGLASFLFGNAAAVSPAQLGALTATLLCVAAAIAFGYRPLSLSLFDEGLAHTLGVRTSLISALLLVAVTAAIVLSIQAVGVVLVAAMLVIPASAALFVARRLPSVLIVASLMGAASGALGAFLSFLFEGFGTGPSMVLAAAALFGVSLVAGPKGLLAQRRGARHVPATGGLR